MTDLEDSELNTVRKSYFKRFCFLALLAILATKAAFYTNDSIPFTEWTIKIFQISSLIIEATGLGKCGYSIQTFGGASPAEKLNDRLFEVFSSLGFFLIIFSFQLESNLA